MSLNFIPGLRPPTLWCVLIVTDGPPRGDDALDHVGIERALHEEVDALARPRSAASSNTSMNVCPMIVRFFSGSSTPASALEKPVLGVDRDELDAEVRAERALDLLALVQSQQPGVDEDAGELIADRAMHERRRDGRIHAAGESADHARVADQLADARRSPPR